MAENQIAMFVHTAPTGAAGRAEATEPRYAGFWSRWTATIIDYLIFIPLSVAGMWGLGHGAGVALALMTVSAVAWFAYVIVCHARWGQTLGKRLAGIRVRDLALRPISLATSVRRTSVDIALFTISIVGYAVVLTRIPAPEFAARGAMGISELYLSTRPAWTTVAERAYWIWVVSEIFTVLFNHRRRAIHDFIGGTLVVAEGSAAIESPDRTPVSAGSRVLGFIDVAGAAVTGATALVFILGAIYSAFSGDRAWYVGTLMIATLAFLVALMFTLANRSMRAGGTSHGWPRGIAAALMLLFASVFVFG